MTRSRLLLPRHGAARRAALGSALVLLSVAHAPAAATAAPQLELASDVARARELYRKGREEMGKEGHLPQAYAFLREAWGLQKSFDTAGNLALVENNLTRYREAAEHATYALSHFPTGGADAQRKGLEEVLAAARAHVGTLTLRVSVDHAAVTLDNQPLGDAPITTEIFVEPGLHTLTASAPGCDAAKDSVRADKGGAHLVTLTLGKCASTLPPQPPGVIVEPTGPRPITVAGFVTTGVGLGLGAAFAILSKIKASDADQKLQSIQGTAGGNPKACIAGSLQVQCSALADARSGEATFANAALWTFVGAAAVGAGTIVYTFALPRTPPPVKAGQAQVIPLAGPGTGGVMLKGAF